MKEDTKEIKDLKDLEEKEIIEDQVEEEQEVEVEEKEEGKEKTPKKKNKKKIIWISVGVGVAILAVIVVLIVVFLPKKEEKENTSNETSTSAFEQAVTKSLKNGNFVKEINKGLEANSISSEKVSVISIDFDSDGDQEIMVYAEEGEKKYLLQLEVDEQVTYDDSYPLTSKDSLGLAYSSIKDENYWYTEYAKDYTIISSTKKIIKEEDFLNDYFTLTQTYKNVSILQNAIEYKMDKNLDVKKLEKTSITEKKVLEDNEIDEDNIKTAYKEYIEKKKEEEKQKEEEEKKKKEQEELEQKLSGVLKLGDIEYSYGTYDIYNADGNVDGQLTIYADGTCVHKGITCDYEVGEVINKDDKLVPGIRLSTGHNYIATSSNTELTDDKETFKVKFVG